MHFHMNEKRSDSRFQNIFHKAAVAVVHVNLVKPVVS